MMISVRLLGCGLRNMNEFLFLFALPIRRVSFGGGGDKIANWLVGWLRIRKSPPSWTTNKQPHEML